MSDGTSFSVNDRRWWAQEQEAAAGEGAGAEAGSKPTYVGQLEAEIAEKDQALADVRARYREAVEELERAKRRIARDAEKQVERQRRETLAAQLDVLDDLDRAVAYAREHDDVAALLRGIELVRATFLAKLEAQGVRRVEPAGERFDPRIHEALATAPVEDEDQDGVVVGVIRPGYLVGDEPLRPAQVSVGRRG